MAEVTIHPEAEAEFEQALGWYLARSEQASLRFEAAFDRAIQAIAATPTLFPQYDPTYRYILLERYPYCLIYRIVGDHIRVIAVASTRRRAGYWSKRG